MGTPKDSEKTRAKIIEAAGRLFAKRGLNGVTVRDIVKDADTHLSALNYHFRTKEALYREVLLEACRANSISAQERRQLLRLAPKRALLVLIKEALREYGEQSASNCQIVLINRECREPSPAFADVVREYLAPQCDFLAQLIARAVDKSSDDNDVRFAVLTLIGLLETFGMYNHLVDAVAAGLGEHQAENDRLAKRLLHLVFEAASPSSEA